MREDSATTRTPCKLLVIRRPHFSRLLKLMPLLMERLQDFDRRYRERAKLAREIKQAEKERKDVEARRKQLTIKSENAKLESAATNLQRGTRGMLARRQTRRETADLFTKSMN
jgi:CRP-like cAMP-binding protein